MKLTKQPNVPMSKLKRILSSLLIAALPIALFIGMSYYLVIQYDALYSTIAGPLYMLSLLFVAAYALTMPFRAYLALQQKGAAEVAWEILLQPLMNNGLLVVLIVALTVLWIWGSQLSIQWAAGEDYPAMRSLTFLLAMLMPVQEIMKWMERKRKIAAYASAPQQERHLRVSVRQLGVMNYLQSILFLVLTWTLATILIKLAKLALFVHLGPYGRLMAYLLLFILSLLSIKWAELKFVKQLRQRLYIP